ncbi:hypothetical protein Droror1_Dr00014488 [Drosera rotundifolia]
MACFFFNAVRFRFHRRRLSSASWLRTLYRSESRGNSLLSKLGFDAYSTQQCSIDKVIQSEVHVMNLAESLASIVVEASANYSKSPKTRIERRRFFESRIKKRVKEHFVNGKFYELMVNVVANPKTLEDAYNCIRVDSNVDESLPDGSICFETLAEELSNRSFNVKENTFSFTAKGAQREVLVLPNFKLKVVQEAMRIVLEIVFKPNFSKISNGGRNDRGHFSALKYLRKGITNPDWWFVLHLNKNVDDCILARLILLMEEKIVDPSLYSFIRSLFDVQVLNFEFGGFMKGVGLPQEGVLSPILMNIYLDSFDKEFYKMSIRYEALDAASEVDESEPHSMLRSWFRRQLKGSDVNKTDLRASTFRVNACRFFDEIFFAVGGSKDAAVAFRSEVQNYLQDFLHLDVDGTELIPCNGAHGIRFLGLLIKRTMKENPRVKAVHKLKDKVKLFADHKQLLWQTEMVRIGKKWLAHGLRKVKESEIKQLADSNSVLSRISCYRKTGMKMDHWFKQLVKIWMQGLNVKATASEDLILSKCIAESALPLELRDSFYKFEKYVDEYISAETESLLALLPSPSQPDHLDAITQILAPVNVMKKRLHRYGLTNAQGYARPSYLLIVLDRDQIIDWFSGVAWRWLRWYRECDNLEEVKLILSEQVRKSCIRTLAQKYRVHEMEVEKQFGSELCRIPSSQEFEHEMAKEMMDALALDYGTAVYSGLSLLSLARIVSTSRPCNCSVFGCAAPAPYVYRVHVMERQKFPGWKTGFSSCIHPSLNNRRVGLCRDHLKDLFLGHISLQSIDFGYR